MSVVEFRRSVEIRYDVDVFVAGGGAAGCAAAEEAARQGSRVLLAEATACLGGMATAGLTAAEGPATDAEALKRSYDDMLTKAGVGFLLMTRVISVAEYGGVRLAVCAGKSGLFAVRAKAFAVCTGDGPESLAIAENPGEADLTLHGLWANAGGDRVCAPEANVPGVNVADERSVTEALVMARKLICRQASQELADGGPELVATGMLPDLRRSVSE